MIYLVRLLVFCEKEEIMAKVPIKICCNLGMIEHANEKSTIVK